MKDQYIFLIEEEMTRLQEEQKVSSHDDNIILSGRLLGLMKAKEIIITTHNEW